MFCDGLGSRQACVTADNATSRLPRRCNPDKTGIRGCDDRRPGKETARIGCTERSRGSLCDKSKSFFCLINLVFTTLEVGINYFFCDAFSFCRFWLLCDPLF